ncbi:MAG TPA: hypothetical protein VIT38_02210 [Allosphingosinicella sp.]|jgi:hypothetical protein
MATARYLLAVALLALAPSPAAARNEVLHSQWLGLRFEQGGQPARLYMRGLYTVEVRLRPGPFRILLPTHGRDDVYQIAAWTSDSIFRDAPVGVDLDNADTEREAVYFGPGTGMADTVAGSGTLYLSDRGHNFLSGLRLGPDRANHVVFYSSTWGEEGVTPLERMNGRLYLIAFYDEDHDGRMENGEYEFIILDFDR